MDTERALFLKTIFCSVCSLEHRVAFGTQMPYLTRHREIDDTVLDVVSRLRDTDMISNPAILTLCQTASHPFLAALLAYDRLYVEIDDRIQCVSSDSHRNDESNYLSYKIQAFESTLSPQLRYDDWPPEVNLTMNQRFLVNFQALLYLRINHMKIRLHFRQKNATSSIHTTDSLVQCAKDTISTCERLIQQSVALPSLRTSFDYFLASSLATIFVVVASNPANYGHPCSAYFHTAIDLLSISQSRFNPPREISCTLGSLRTAAERINMPGGQIRPRRPSAQVQINREEYPHTSIGTCLTSRPFKLTRADPFTEELLQWDLEVDLHGLVGF
jgi:hypothetical protein